MGEMQRKNVSSVGYYNGLKLDPRARALIAISTFNLKFLK